MLLFSGHGIKRTMQLEKLKVAVVEDNGMARTNIRNHLLDMGFNDIGCYSNGRELRNNIKSRTLDLLLMDFHLGDHKNGVEVLQELKQDGLIRHTTCVMFITSDRLPLIIGQIIDVHPEALVIKPYTIRHLEKNIMNCMRLHQFLLPVYELMDDHNYAQALVVVDILLDKDEQQRQYSALIRLRARILTKLKRYAEAVQIYQQVLEGSDKIIWAKWGLVHNLFLDNKIAQSQQLLHELTKSQLTSIKASEWLARICIDNNQYSKAESHLTKIRDGDLSLSATKLKAYIYQAQDRGQQAIELLNKKRESQRSVRERFDEITLELARCYLLEAQEKPEEAEKEEIEVAKVLIGSVRRAGAHPTLRLKKDYMQVATALAENNPEKAKELLARPGMDELQQADIATLHDAIVSHQTLGNVVRARELLAMSQRKLQYIDESNEKTIASMLVSKSAETIGDQKPMALSFNKRGQQHYAQKRFVEAIDDFYKAYQLFPRELAFSLNLLQGLVDASVTQYKAIQTLEFLNELQQRKLNEANRQRLEEIISRVTKKQGVFFANQASKA
jgi:CheY-like chemotaxis protein